VPLVQFTASRAKMGQMTTPLWLVAFSLLIAASLIALNIKLLSDVISGG